MTAAARVRDRLWLPSEWERPSPIVVPRRRLRLVPPLPALSIGNPAQVGTNGPLTTAAASIATASPCVIPPGSLVVVVVQTGSSTTDPGVPTNATDGTNTSTVADLSVWVSNGGRISVFSWFDTAGRTATITSNFASTSERSIWVFTIANAASANWLDVTGSSTSASSTAFAVTTSSPNAGKAAQADEIAFGVFSMGTTDTTPTTFPGAGWTSLVNSDESVRHVRTCVEYVNGVTSGATVTADGTGAAANSLARGVLTYKGGGAVAVYGAFQ